LREFIDKHRDTYGVEPICKVLQIAPSGYRHHAALRRAPDRRCARVQRDEVLVPQIKRIAMVRMRSDARTREYVVRRTGEGLSKKEIHRCLKRYIVRELYPLILADLADSAGSA
jgi:hypothetical protein